MPALRLFVPTADGGRETVSSNAPPPPPGRNGAVTVRHVLDWFERSQSGMDAHPKVLKERRRLWALFADEFGDQMIQDCKRYQLVDWLNRHAGDKAAHTRRRWNATIQVAFNKAAELDFIASNPFFGIKMPKGDQGRDWTEAEYRAILRSTRNAAFRRFIVFIRFSGMRPGEIAGFQWPHLKVDGDNARIELSTHKTVKKTGKPRVIPVNRVMAKLLDWQRNHTPAGSKNVFLNSKGTPWKTRALAKNLDSIRKRAGLPDDVKCHGGRHTFITQSLMNGVDLATVARLAGHQHVSTTEGYAHLAGKMTHLSEAMEKAVTVKPKVAKASKPVAKPEEILPLFAGLD